jgi:MSHA pilin protein MshC
MQAGFTLIELIVVTVIVGVLASIAVPRFVDNRTFDERGYFEELAAALRYSRSAAVNTGCPVRFVLTATAYLAEQQQELSGRCDPFDSGWGEPLQLADGSTVAGAAPTGVAAAPAVSFVFDALGATSLGSNQAINVGPYALLVHASSGFTEIP